MAPAARIEKDKSMNKKLGSNCPDNSELKVGSVDADFMNESNEKNDSSTITRSITN